MSLEFTVSDSWCNNYRRAGHINNVCIPNCVIQCGTKDPWCEPWLCSCCVNFPFTIQKDEKDSEQVWITYMSETNDSPNHIVMRDGSITIDPQYRGCSQLWCWCCPICCLSDKDNIYRATPYFRLKFQKIPIKDFPTRKP